MTPQPPPKRQLCTRCQRPQNSCICHWVTPIRHEVELLILQHPLEVSQAKGSARLLHLSLPGSRLLVGETFDPAVLAAALAPPPDHNSPPRQNILLYPETPPDAALGLFTPASLPEKALKTPSNLRLIVLDGTWRKSRKMLYLNPELQKLPRLSLQPGTAASRYLIRKAHKPGQLSTLEATCIALTRLEGDEERFLPLLKAFEGFVGERMGWVERTREADS